VTTATVRTPSSAVAEMASDWPLLSALMGGTRAMRAAGQAFLPKFPAEDDSAYKARLSTAVLTNFFGRTCAVMASKPFSQEIGLGKISADMAKLVKDIDGQGSELQSFAETLFRGCLSHGVAGVLVDCPAVMGVKNKADERRAGIRPYWAHYPASTILGAKAKRIGGEWRLMQLRLLETAVEDDGEFGEKAIEQVRVLTPGAWAIWRKKAQSLTGVNEWEVLEEGTTSLDFIPCVFFYGQRAGFGMGTSPLLDLAYLNAEHWQSSSDQQTILHVARVPILFGSGFESSTPIAIGGSSAVIVSDDNAKLQYVEHSGAALDAGRQSILDLEDRMRQAGAELLVKRRSSVTATQVVSEGDANKCILQSIVESFEDGLNACLAHTARWIGDSAPGVVDLFKDFGVDSLTDASAALLLDAAVAGKISDETFFEEMRRRKVIDSEREWSAEAERIKAQPPAPITDPALPKLPIKPGKAD
jgi:hypothetical protein